MRTVLSLRRAADSDDENGIQYKAVSFTGRQPGSDVFVFGPTVQVSLEGRIIPEEEQEYLWIPAIIHKNECIVNALSCIPSIPAPLHSIIDGLLNISGRNLPSAVFIIGTNLTMCVAIYYNTLQILYMACNYCICISSCPFPK